MKTTFNFLFFLALINLIIINGCKKDSTSSQSSTTTNNNTNTFTKHFTAKINGKDFSAFSTAYTSSGILLFQSDQSHDDQFFFEFPANITAKTYNYNAIGISIKYALFNHGDYTIKSGKVIITKNDSANKQLSGTFELTAIEYEFGNPIDTVVVTNGSFGVEYTVLK